MRHLQSLEFLNGLPVERDILDEEENEQDSEDNMKNEQGKMLRIDDHNEGGSTLNNRLQVKSPVNELPDQEDAET